MVRLALSILAACFVALGALPSTVQAQGYSEEPSARDIVVAYNVGWRFSISPGVLIPTGGEGKVGFSIAGDVRYGFELGPTVLAPGLRLGGYFPSDNTILVALGTTRLTIPVGPVGPYVLGGIGPGYVSDPSSEVGIAYLVGGGFMVHVGTRFAVGAEASYQAITGTDFSALFIGPALLLAF
jgi:hypothetical protein